MLSSKPDAKLKQHNYNEQRKAIKAKPKQRSNTTKACDHNPQTFKPALRT